jgi:hypothetical protein
MTPPPLLCAEGASGVILPFKYVDLSPTPLRGEKEVVG